jgi:hypothetical protein
VNASKSICPRELMRPIGLETEGEVGKSSSTKMQDI